MKTYYELLEVAPNAPADEIKRAFRREIAKYHPDKVQHLGKEFQDIAANKAAELTQAYKTLSDETRRGEYDELLADGGHPPVARGTAAPDPSHSPEAANRAAAAGLHRPAAEPAVPRRRQFDSELRGVNDLVRRATLARFQTAITGEFGSYEELRLAGFEVAALPTAKFWSFRLPPRVLGKFVAVVDGSAIADAWTAASKVKTDGQRDLCVFLMGPALASPSELAVAITEQRKRPVNGGGKLVLIPVSTKDWSAHVPTDAPDSCKSILARLKANS